MHKLADHLARSGNIFDAGSKVYPTKSASYHFTVVNGLVKGFRKAATEGLSRLIAEVLQSSERLKGGAVVFRQQSGTKH